MTAKPLRTGADSHLGYKSAAIGGEQEAGFEQAFSSLAYAYLKDKAPRLLDYIVGFQLVERNEDNTKAVGIFGFKVGPQWLYAPVFFLNGDLKGHELLYIKNQDVFVPLKENWVNYVMSRKPHVLGERSMLDTQQLGGLHSNLRDITQTPSQSKFGFDNLVISGIVGGVTKIAEWAKPAMHLVASAATKKARFIYRVDDRKREFDMAKVASAPFSAALAGLNLTLPEFLAHNVNLARGAHQVYQQYPAIKQAIDQFHGSNLFVRLAEQLSEQVKSAASNIMPVGKRRKKRQLFPDAEVADLARRGAGDKDFERYALKKLSSDSIMPAAPVVSTAPPVGKVRIWDKAAAQTPVGVARLTDGQRSKIATHGYLVEDERTGEEVTVAYKTQVANELANPHDTGLYEVLERPGSFSQMLVISHPISNRGRADSVTVIRLRDSGDKSWLNAHRTSIWTESNKSRTEFDKWFNDLGKSSLQVGGTYVAVTGDGSGTVPFKVRESVGEDAYRVDFRVDVSWDDERDGSMPPVHVSYDPNQRHTSSYDAKLVINKHDNTTLRAMAGELYVPNEAKFIELSAPAKPSNSDNLLCCCDTGTSSSESKDSPIEPGRIEDIQMLFMNKTARMKLYGDNSEVTVYSEKRGFERMPWQQAMFSMIKNHGLSEKTSREVLKQAQTKGHCIFRVKYAQGYPLPGPGPDAPAFPGPETGSEQVGYGQVNAIYPQEEYSEIPGMSSSMTDPSVYDPFIMPDQNAMGMAQQAAGRGQKEVFDTAMIGGMLKTVRQDSLVDRYLGDLMKALDRLGRIMFLFYWHQEEFQDRYGKSDIPELEDALRNSFESLGDIVLFLKEKTIEAPASDMGDVTLDETSRN